jgi:NAD(P)H-hydrate epimerase
MLNLPHSLYTADQTRELDRLVIETHRIPGATLMARAGAAALGAIKQYWPQAGKIVIVCGGGNNGGDGYELARQALPDGFSVSLYELGKVDKMSEETRSAREALIAAGHHPMRFEDSLADADVIVDCLFGTGLDREVSGHYATAIERINLQAAPVLAVDIPSGIHADSGHALGVAVKATVTLSFLGLNMGLFTGDGPDFCGELRFDSLKAPDSVHEKLTPIAYRLDRDDCREQLKPRQRTGHKGLYGHALVVGGDKGMSGAAHVAAEAAARLGAGLTSVATHSNHAPILNLTRPELMCHGIEQAEELIPLIDKASVLILGPGLGQSSWSQALFDAAIKADLPMVVDADGLNLLSQAPQHHDNWILTPHPGEAARLLNTTSKAIQADRIKAVQDLQQRYGGVIVLKGAGTLIYDGKTTLRLCSFGNPGMASGGMGDALSGVIGGLLAQHLGLLDAASIGVTLHGLAADKAAELDGERGMLAMDLMPHLRHLANLCH